MQQTQHADALVLGAQHVGFAAAQALLFASREQPGSDLPSGRFRRMAKVDSPVLLAYLQAWHIPPGIGSFGEAADAIINRRNATLHYGRLEEDVSAPLALLARHPSLDHKCRQESLVLDAFQELTAAFQLQ